PRVEVEGDAALLASEDEVEVAIAVHVEERGVAAAAGVDVLEAVGDEDEAGLRARPFVAVEVQLAGGLAHEQVEVAVAVDVGECGRAMTAAGERDGARGVLDPARLAR